VIDEALDVMTAGLQIYALYQYIIQFYDSSASLTGNQGRIQVV